eukprot:c387_g1_i1.p1 GENE.c387_g1_i1~~c387_g1_i1.p1  ORF type:complete len:144 (-),score=37.88 c387_g1_i1:175-606(-)
MGVCVRLAIICLTVLGVCQALYSVHKGTSGHRIQLQGSDDIYLVDNGYRRKIPSIAAYNRLFSPSSKIDVVDWVNTIDPGLPLDDDVELIRSNDPDSDIYLMDNHTKRRVTRNVVAKYGFATHNARPYNQPLLDAIPDGDPIG